MPEQVFEYKYLGDNSVTESYAFLFQYLSMNEHWLSEYADGLRCLLYTSHPDTGIYHNPGDFGNLPAGEAFIAPVEGTAQGVIVIDGAMSGVGVVEEPIKMTVESGYVTEITGGHGARMLEDAIADLGKPARNIAELGVGTNDRAIITGKVLEDEKVLGTVHLALGNNVGFGGTCDVPVHLDGIILRPTLVIDDEVIIKEGALQINAG